MRHWSCSPAPQRILNQHRSILKIKLNFPGRDSLFPTLLTKICQAVSNVSKRGRNVWYTLLKIKVLLVGSELFSRGWEEGAIPFHIASTFCIPLDEAVEALSRGWHHALELPSLDIYKLKHTSLLCKVPSLQYSVTTTKNPHTHSMTEYSPQA